MKFDVVTCCCDQRGTYLYIPRDISVNVMLGIQAAMKGDNDPASANVRDIMKNRIKINDSRNPKAI